MIWMTLLNLSMADTIDSVLVFTDRAEITRTGSATCSNGNAELTFENLPISTDTKTLRSEMLSKGTVIGVRHKTIVQGESVDKRVKELFAERDELWQTLRVKSDANAALGKELQMVEKPMKNNCGIAKSRTQSR